MISTSSTSSHTIGIIGMNGRMGQGLVQACATTLPEARVIGYDKRRGDKGHYVDSLDELWQTSSVVLDFSHASLFSEVIRTAVACPKPFVLGTSGVEHDDVHHHLKALAQYVPVMWAPNTCLGAVLQRWMAHHIATVIPTSYDVDIVEMHHRYKEDSPSGTALALAQAISQGNFQQDRPGQTALSWGLASSPRPEGRIEMHAMRVSHIPCQHRAMWTSPMEQLEITHTVFSRDALVQGAVDLLIWLLSPKRAKGLYSVEDRWGLSLATPWHPQHGVSPTTMESSTTDERI